MWTTTLLPSLPIYRKMAMRRILTMAWSPCLRIYWNNVVWDLHSFTCLDIVYTIVMRFKCRGSLSMADISRPTILVAFTTTKHLLAWSRRWPLSDHLPLDQRAAWSQVYRVSNTKCNGWFSTPIRCLFCSVLEQLHIEILPSSGLQAAHEAPGQERTTRL